MIKNIEEGVKRTAFVIWIIWVLIWSFADGLIEPTIIEWIIFVLQGDLFNSFNDFKYAFKRLGVFLVWVVGFPYIIYFVVSFIWKGFFGNFDDKNKK